jgi:hypothetical protein
MDWTWLSDAVRRTYHELRWSVSSTHATAWTASQTIATVLAFIAAWHYARLTQKLLRVEQTPIVVLVDGHAKNVGRGVVINAMLYHSKPEQTWWIGSLSPGGKSKFDATMIGIIETRVHVLYYQDASGAWYATEVSRTPLAQGLVCAILGRRARFRIPELVRERARTSTVMSSFLSFKVFPLKTLPGRWKTAAEMRWNKWRHDDMFGGPKA